MKSDPPENDYDSALARWVSRTSAPGDDGEGFGTPKNDPAQLEALERVRAWTQQRFRLPADAAILVSELECRLPGCPPLETVIAFWDEGKRHHFKLFKPVKQITFDDLPFTWMKSELVVPEDFSCECC